MSYRREARAPRFPESAATAHAERVMRDAMATVHIPSVREARDVAASAPTSDAPQRPSVLISLRDDGGLQVEIRGEARLRTLKLSSDSAKAISTVRSILSGQLARNIAIGLDGAPTQAQVRHWEAHSIWPSSECPFCISEGRCGGKSTRSARPVARRAGDGSVEVRTIPARGKLATATTKTAEELGL